MTSILLFLFFITAEARSSMPPDVLRSTNENRRAPLWVAASKAAAADGALAREHFEPHELRWLRREREPNRPHASSNDGFHAQSCFGESPVEIAAPAGSLKALANAPAILEGAVIGRNVGFLAGTPGALLSIRVDVRSERENTFSVPDEVLVYYPEAEFSVGDRLYCVRPATHPARPRVGDRVVVFAYGPPVDATGRLLYVQASKHLIFETPDGRLLPPAALREELARLSIMQTGDVMTWLEGQGLRRKMHRTAIR